MNRHLLLVGPGFVGKIAAAHFRSEGWKVTTVARSEGADQRADVSDKAVMQTLAERIARVTHVLHCASAGGGGVEAYRAVYRDGARNLTELFPNAHILFTSSTSVYPQQDGEMVTEESSTELERETGQVLLEAEHLVLAAGGTVARLSGIYGWGRSYLLKRLLAGQATLEEEGSRILNHIHHEDVVTACSHLFTISEQSRGEVYNVSDSAPRSQAETYQLLCDHFGLPFPPSAPRNLNSKRGWSNKAVSNAKIVASGWQPRYPDFCRVAGKVAASLDAS